MRRIALVMTAIALMMTACSAASDQIAEQIAEQGSGVNDVDIDSDSGEIRVETDDGSMVIGGGEIPDGFPIGVMDGYTVQSVFSTDNETAVALLYDEGTYDALVDFYDDWTAGDAAEWKFSTASFDSADGKAFRQSTWVSDNGTIGLIDCYDVNTSGLDGVCASVISG